MYNVSSYKLKNYTPVKSRYIMVDTKEKKDCCGCRACEHSCPQNAITMTEDIKGFRYPVIDHDNCTECENCDAVCSFSSNYLNNGENPRIYAAKNINEDIRKSSTSGGMFSAISDEIIENGGVVYGVSYDENLYVHHERATTKEEYAKFKGSKYIQSDTGNTFVNINADLIAGKKVLFTGTPCQVAALKSFLNRDFDNLLTVDIACHGTPSNKLWKEYLNILEQEKKISVVNVNFRDKSAGWHAHKVRIDCIKDGAKTIIRDRSFLQLFYQNYSLMPCCFNCHFTNLKRPGDITIADFWGIEKSMPEYDDDKGVSLLIVSSEKGNVFIEKISNRIDMQISSKDNCMQNALRNPASYNKQIDNFWNDYEKNGLKFVLDKYTDYNTSKTFIKKIVKKIKMILRIK